MPFARKRLAGFACVAVLSMVLTACQSVEDRAERHYQSALELIAEGDTERAVIEFRNVFENMPGHREARLAFAEMLTDSGDVVGGYRNYLLVSENEPDNLDLRLLLSQLAFTIGDGEGFERHSEKAIEIAPDDARVQAIAALAAYQSAVREQDAPARREAASALSANASNLTDETIAQRIEIDNLLRDGEYRAAISAIDSLLAADSSDVDLQTLKLQVLGQLGDTSEIQTQLEGMVAEFPENEGFATTLIQWYVSQGDTDAAEAFIRSRVSDGEDGENQRTLLISFLAQTKGVEAAIAEADAAIEAGVNTDLFRSLRAGLRFDQGARDEAIAELEDILTTAEPGEQTSGIKVALARMQLSVGNEVAARQRVEEVLAEDAGNVEALKMRAAWLIDEDNGDGAIGALRSALDQAPNDPQIMTLMAQAHLRNGSRGLAGEMLSLAVEASGAAAQQSLDYANFLIADDNLATAETVIINALRISPSNARLLNVLGQIYVRQEDWSRAEQVEATLRRLGTEQAENAAAALEVARLQGQNRSEEALAILDNMAREAGGPSGAAVAAVRARVAAGDVEGAESYVDGLIAESPDNVQFRLLRAGILQADNRAEEAEDIYREVLAENDQIEGIWRALYISKLRRGDASAAEAVLQEAIAAMPEAPNLLWALAGELERDGDIEGAIAIYEQLYERLSGSPIVANNLASLIATYGGEEADIQRAYALARRLSGSDIPAFQDTYGWIAFRRGQIEEAIEYLEPAAAGLPGDPVVQFHLASAYAAAERHQEALDQFRKAIEVAGPGDTRPQFETAKQEIARIEALLAAQ